MDLLSVTAFWKIYPPTFFESKFLQPNLLDAVCFHLCITAEKS